MYVGRIADSCVYFAASLRRFVRSEWQQEAKIENQLVLKMENGFIRTMNEPRRIVYFTGGHKSNVLIRLNYSVIGFQLSTNGPNKALYTFFYKSRKSLKHFQIKSLQTKTN